MDGGVSVSLSAPRLARYRQLDLQRSSGHSLCLIYGRQQRYDPDSRHTRYLKDPQKREAACDNTTGVEDMPRDERDARSEAAGHGGENKKRNGQWDRFLQAVTPRIYT